MSIKATCTCGAEFKVKDELAGKRAKCPKCGEAFTIPKPTAATNLIRVTCQCGKAVKAKTELAGKRVKCPACGQALGIPSPNAESDAPKSADDSDVVGKEAAATDGPASSEAVRSADHGQSKPEKSNRHRFILLGIGGAGVGVVLLLVVAGLGVFRHRPAPEQIDDSERLGMPPEVTNSIGMRLILIPPGEFMMGSSETPEELARLFGISESWFTREHPQDRVRITKPFYLGVYEVSQSEYEKVMGENPNRFDKDAGKPVGYVSQENAREFCRRLSEKEGKTYRLPTEAEWEYACRAGTTTLYSSGNAPESLGDYAWYRDNSKYNVHPVGQKSPNAWGLYDMHGNVAEWCHENHFKRGGSCNHDPVFCRSAHRTGPEDSTRRSKSLGFRIALGEMPEEARDAIAKPAQSDERILAYKAAREAAEKSAQEATKEAGATQKECSQNLGTPVEITNSIGMKLKLIPPGEFMMGSPESDDKATKDEKPQHKVRITKACYIGTWEVTRVDFERLKGAKPRQSASYPSLERKASDLNAGLFPVELSNWRSAVEFCRKLSELPEEKAAGWNYRLPTEAEWEYACRAGTTTRWSCSDEGKDLEGVAWFAANSDGTPHPAGEKQPNAWGLFDMHGNAWEWCHDWHDEDYYQNSPMNDPLGPTEAATRVFRGGGWWDDAGNCRSAFRSLYFPLNETFAPGLSFALGFRVAADVSGE